MPSLGHKGEWVEDASRMVQQHFSGFVLGAEGEVGQGL